ncbi:MAG: C25 family cysteine peptidase [Candidatus Cloacimonadota bacterium]|nr:C25 family cysteine peptidase [Candidatus Cloacimonadota bacterium]
MLRKILLIAISVMIILSISGEVFQVEQMTESEIIIKFRNSNYTLSDVGKSSNYKIIQAEGANNFPQEGQPNLPSYSTIIGIPVDGNISVSITKKSEIELTNINLNPTKKQMVNNITNKVEAVSYRDDIFYSQNNYFPIRELEKGSKAFIGDRNSQGLIINPFRYNPKQQSLKIIKEATIKITISGDKTKSRNMMYLNNKMNGLFINNKFSKYWLKEREKYTDYEPDRLDYVDEIQLIVDQEGICKVSYSYLVDSLQTWQDSLNFVSGFDWNILDPRNLELTDEYGPVPIYFSGEQDGAFDEEDFFEFYCQPHFGDEGYYDDYTAENTYTLRLKDTVGFRMAVEDGGLNISDDSQFEVPVNYQQTQHFEEQNSYQKFGHLTDLDFLEDCYMWQTMASPNLVSVGFDLEYPSTYGNKRCSATAAFMGVTYRDASFFDHHAIIRLNSDYIEDISWEDQGRKIAQNDSIYNAVLNHGSNQLNISMPGDTEIDGNEQIALDYFDLSYWREYKTDSDLLKFSKPSDEDLGLFQFELNNFSQPDISVYKVGSSKMENLQIEAFAIDSNLPPYKCTFQDSVLADNIQYYAVTENNKISPKFLMPNIPSDLHNPNYDVNYIIITKREFCDDEGTLLIEEVWENEGVSVKIVDVQDIFDEYNYGIRSIESMKQFVRFAYNNWNTSHVLLLGDGHSDERDWSRHRDSNVIPYKNVWHWKSGASASDTWLACIIGDDGVPDISTGRINVWQKEQILPIAEKIQEFVQNKNYDELWQPRITLTAGGKSSDDTPGFFGNQSEQVRNSWIPQEMDVTRIYTSESSTYSSGYLGGTFDLKDMIDNGTQIVQFMGHGGGHIWADYNLFNQSDINTLTNEIYPFFISLSCYGSAYNNPGAGCLGEFLVLKEGVGGIGQLGFTGLGYMNADLTFAYAFYEGIFGRGLRNIGELKRFTVAKMWTSYPENYEVDNHGKSKVALTYGASYIGDPMIDMWYPPKEGSIEVRNHNTGEVQHNVAVGDTVNVVAIFPDDIIMGQVLIQNEEEIGQNIFYDLPSIGGEITVEGFVVPNIDGEMELFRVKAYGFADDRQISAYSEMTVGKSSVANLVIEPIQPVYSDSVMISANFFDEDGVDSAICRVFLNLSSKSKSSFSTTTDNRFSKKSRDYTDIPMIWNEQEQKYNLSYKIPPQNTGAWVRYEFRILDSNNNLSISEIFNYKVFGPEVVLSEMRLSEEEGEPILQVFLSNTGGLDANNFDVKLFKDYDSLMVAVDSLIVEELPKSESKWVNLDLPIITEAVILYAVANENRVFSEANYSNNYESRNFELNMESIPITGGSISSLDGVVVCDIPENTFATETVFYINRLDEKNPINQPDISYIKTVGNNDIFVYEINTLNYEVLEDSLYFPDYLTIQFNCSPSDSLFNIAYDNARVGIYRWIESYQKWIWVGSEVVQQNHQVFTQINSVGIYGVFANYDNKPPSIEVNVENQEFTNGGYVSDIGVFSFTFMDANGIDIFNEKISIFVNQEEIDDSKFSINTSLGHLINLPVKYQIDLEKGDYTMSVQATDVNNNFDEINFDFIVNDEFDVKNFANYPNPVRSKSIDPVNENRTRFTYVLTDDADEVKIKVYTVSGRLIKTFENLPAAVGYHEFPRSVYGWDCRDDEGMFIANGIYFYKIIAKSGSKTVEKIQKMSILK